MSYKLEFKKSALKEWHKLDESIKAQLKKRLAARLSSPHVASARLSGMPDCYKIKLRDAGYRLVYEVDDKRLVVVVIAVGRRDHDLVYKLAQDRV
jgi:mRNA interferase RelE/StbE